MEEIIITKKLGRWLINGKTYPELVESNSIEELAFFDEFINEMKWQLKEFDFKLKKCQ